MTASEMIACLHRAHTDSHVQDMVTRYKAYGPLPFCGAWDSRARDNDKR